LRPRTKNSATKIATNTTAAITIPAIAPPLNPPPPPDGALLVVALAVALVVVVAVEVEFPVVVDPPPSAGMDWPGTSI
jgi:hypothetical protein